MNRIVLALAGAVLLAVGSAGPASAIIYQHQTGLIGPWSWNDVSSAPNVLCKYGESADNNHFPMRKIVVQPPTVKAADRDSNKIDKRTISWQFQLQRKQFPDGTWNVIASSAIQKAQATESQAASFTALSLGHRPKSPPYGDGWVVRVQVLIKWIKGDGTVEGTMLFWPSYYHAVSPGFDFVGGNPYCGEVQTNG